MAEQENVVSFFSQQVKRVHARFDTLDEWFIRREARVAQVERRLMASTHFEPGLVAHMASPHERMDNFRASTMSFDRRIAALETR